MLNHVPDELEVDAEILVDQPIAHAGHCAPFELRMPGPEVVRDLLGRLANDLQAADEGAAQGLVGGKKTNTTSPSCARSGSRLRRGCAAGSETTTPEQLKEARKVGSLQRLSIRRNT